MGRPSAEEQRQSSVGLLEGGEPGRMVGGEAAVNSVIPHRTWHAGPLAPIRAVEATCASHHSRPCTLVNKKRKKRKDKKPVLFKNAQMRQ